jgi:hypothetical protein
MLFAATDTRLSRPASNRDGSPSEDPTPQRVHLETLAKRCRDAGRPVHPECRVLDIVVPEPLEYLWDWFRELARTRRASMAGIEPLGYADVDAWARLTDRNPAPEEVEALLTLDVVTRHPELVRDDEEEAA